MEKPVRLLMVEDSEDDAELIIAQLERGGFQPSLCRVWTSEELQKALDSEAWEIILSDYAMPRFNGRAALDLLKASGKDIPFIMISGTMGDDIAVSCMKAGASDYLMKDNLSRLAPAIERELLEAEKRREKARIEGELNKSEERFRLMVEQVKDYGIITTDPEGVVTDWNPSVERITGFHSGEMLGRSIGTIFTPEDRDDGYPERELQQAGHDGSVENIRWHIRKDGGRFWAKGFTNVLRNADGIITGFSKILRDETETKRRDDAQNVLDRFTGKIASSIDFQQTLKHMADTLVPELGEWCAIDVRDKSGNGSAHLVIRHLDPAKEALLHRLRVLYPPGSNATHPVKKVLDSDQPYLVKSIDDKLVRSIARDEQHLEMLNELACTTSVIVPLTAHDISFGTVTVGAASREKPYDEGDMRLVEELARRGGLALDNARLYSEAREANRLKDEFLAAVSHELRTPLNAMLGFSELLVEGHCADPEETREAAEAIHRNAIAQFRLVEDLLDISKIVSGKMRLEIQTCDLNNVVLDSIRSTEFSAKARNIVINQVIGPGLDSVQLDPTRVQQIIWNLLSNAVKFTPPGGQVAINVRREGLKVIMEVTDTGRGIDPTFLPYVFDRFRQEDGSLARTSGGLGLGLAITKQLVELHGGIIEARSQGRGAGCCFAVTLPMIPSPPTKT